MKKSVLTIALGLGIYTASLANNVPDNNGVGNGDQKEKVEQAKKTKKYDFSLFKFVSPSKNEQKDTTNTKIQKKKIDTDALKETTFHYEKPRSFLMFS